MMKFTYQFKISVLLCFLPFQLIADVNAQETQNRFTDFKVIIDYYDIELKKDQKYIFKGVGPSSLNNPEPGENVLHLVKYSYTDNERIPTDSLTVVLTKTQIDSLFELSTHLFDLKGKVNISEHVIPLPPLLRHEGYNIHYTFDLMFRGSKYTRTLSDRHKDFQPIHNYLSDIFLKKQSSK